MFSGGALQRPYLNTPDNFSLSLIHQIILDFEKAEAEHLLVATTICWLIFVQT